MTGELKRVNNYLNRLVQKQMTAAEVSVQRKRSSSRPKKQAKKVTAPVAGEDVNDPNGPKRKLLTRQCVVAKNKKKALKLELN